MITAVDTSVLLDVLVADPVHAESSLVALQEARSRGGVVVCPVVWSEVRAFLTEDAEMQVLAEAGIAFDPFDRQTADLAGGLWRRYRRGGGKRVKLIPDFLIAAHAQVRADALLTRDRGFTKRYFEGLVVVAP